MGGHDSQTGPELCSLTEQVSHAEFMWQVDAQPAVNSDIRLKPVRQAAELTMRQEGLHLGSMTSSMNSQITQVRLRFSCAAHHASTITMNSASTELAVFHEFSGVAARS